VHVLVELDQLVVLLRLARRDASDRHVVPVVVPVAWSAKPR
jgi:hypothetical protein